MRSVSMCTLLFTTILTAGMGNSAAAQERGSPIAVERAVPDASAIERRLRDRGVPEDRIGISVARLRAAIASGQYPHLERRIYNFLNPPAAGDRPTTSDPSRVRPERLERPDVNSVGAVRPADDRPALNRPATDASAASRVATPSRVQTAPRIAQR